MPGVPGPTGTITFLFTDIEGSTKLWEQYPTAMKSALHRHDAIWREAVGANQGYVFKTIGDAFCVAFPTAPQALAATLQAQRVLHAEDWGEIGEVRVRAALHTGTAEERDGDYFGPSVNRVSRLLSAGHGGQTLLSAPTQELVRDHLPPGASLPDMGERRLKDLQRPERIFQLVAPGLTSEFPPLKTLDTLPNNLPIQLTSFIGREREMEEVKQLLGMTRLLTLIGPGGTGKTRLSLHVAADLLDLDLFPHGAWLVELAPLADPSLVPQAVASALGVRESAGSSTLESLKEYLNSKQLLLVLDNCEHLVEACAQLADALLRSCPNLKILASSREALGIGGETIWRVPSLSLPDPRHSTGSNLASTLSQYEAVRLFIDRAQAALPSFKVTNHNAPAVAQICHRLDGIPLAIELAVARVRALSVEQISARLDDRFRLLTGGSRTALPRQQTLRAAIDWSYGLLSEAECVILRRLSVFAGGWTPEAAEAVCSGGGIEEYEVLDSLMRLVDKSLVTFEQAEEATSGGEQTEAGEVGEARYRLLETIRQYARDKLLEAGEGEIQGVRDRHMGYFLKFAEEAEPRLLGVAEGPWLDRVEMEHDNLRLAMEWSLEGSGALGGDTEASKIERAEVGLRIAGALSAFWGMRGHYTEGRRWLRQMLAAQESLGGGRTVGRAKALVGLGRLTGLQSGELKAQTLHTEALEIYRELGNKFGMIRPLNMLGHMANRSGDYNSARSYYVQALTIAKEFGETRRVIVGFSSLGNLAINQGNYAEAKALLEEGIRVALTLGIEGATFGLLAGLGSVAINQGEYDKAKSLYEESLAQTRALGQRGDIQGNLWMLAHIARRQGEYERAQTLFTESMIMAQDLEMTESIAMNLQGMAELALVRNEPERAAKLLGAFEAVYNRMGAEVYFDSRIAFDESKAALVAQLGEEGWTKAFEAGLAMSMEEAIRYAIDQPVER